MFKKYLNKYLKNEFIISSRLIDATLILFIKKKTNELCLCVDYRELNAFIVKNRYLISLINETLNQIINVKYFIKLNIIAAYNKIRIKKTNEKLRFTRVTTCINIVLFSSISQIHRRRFKRTLTSHFENISTYLLSHILMIFSFFLKS